MAEKLTPELPLEGDPLPRAGKSLVERLRTPDVWVAVHHGGGRFSKVAEAAPFEAADCIAELTEALERAQSQVGTLSRNILDEVGLGTCDNWVNALNGIAREINATLAKIGGNRG